MKYITLLLLCSLILLPCQARAGYFFAAPAGGGGGGGGIPTPDLLHWPLNDASGSTIVAAVGSGSTTSTGTLNADYLSMAAGNTAFIASTNTAWASDVVTASFWFRKSEWSSTGPIFRSCYINANPRFELAQEGGWMAATITDTTGGLKQWVYQPFALNSWTHVVAVWDNSTGSGSTALYINGASVSLTTASSTKTGTGIFGTDQLSVKSIFGDGAVFDLDDLRIHGRALTGGEISALYSAGRP